jgi:hypothetical protein
VFELDQDMANHEFKINEKLDYLYFFLIFKNISLLSKNKWLTAVVEEILDDYIKVSITFIEKDNYNSIDIMSKDDEKITPYKAM